MSLTIFMGLLIWLGSWAAVLWWYRRCLGAFWCEPMLKHPVLIIESDDWGVGPLNQAVWLDRLSQALSGFRDRQGNPPVMTLGVVLATADSVAMAQENWRYYRRQTLESPCYTGVLKAIRHGEADGVFAVQLHGMEHYWPEALMAASAHDSAVMAWLSQGAEAQTEQLPPPLQSRWINAATLPSQPLEEEAIRTAVAEEVACFKTIFGKLPDVVVPPTFVWNNTVEQSWAQQGVRVVVTPGQRNAARNAAGKPVTDGKLLYHGQHAITGVYYAVRMDYFEPALGHTVEQALMALAKNTRLGRPTLLEMHRFNFLQSDPQGSAALEQLKTLYHQALTTHPDTVFCSTATLNNAMQVADPALIERRFSRRLSGWLKRAAQVNRLRKLVWLSGAIVLLGPITLGLRYCSAADRHS